MKPGPLLATLGLALLVGALAFLNRPTVPPPLPPAPLPGGDGLLEKEPEPVVLLAGPLTPENRLVDFVEESLGLEAKEVPVFEPVDAGELVEIIRRRIESWSDLESMEKFGRTMGWTNDFTSVADNLTALAAAEVRGWIDGDDNFIVHDFQPEDPSEQAALVHLLAQRILHDHLSALPEAPTAAAYLARSQSIEALAESVERRYREKFPPTEPSLHENLRESVLVGMPAFFYELAAYSEFHLLPLLKPDERATDWIANVPAGLAGAPTTKSDEPGSSTKFTLGPIMFHILLIRAGGANDADALAAQLQGDELTREGDDWIWTLELTSPGQAGRVLEILNVSLPEPAQPAREISADGSRILIRVSANPVNSDSAGLPSP